MRRSLRQHIRLYRLDRLSASCSVWPKATCLCRPASPALNTVSVCPHLSTAEVFPPEPHYWSLSLFFPTTSPSSSAAAASPPPTPSVVSWMLLSEVKEGPNSPIAAVTQPPETRPMSRTLSHTHTHTSRDTHTLTEKCQGTLRCACVALVEQVTTTVFHLVVERQRTRGWKQTYPR